MARRGGFTTQPPKQITLVIAVVLWLAGLLDGLDVISLPATWGSAVGFWALVVAGLLLILGSLFDGL